MRVYLITVLGTATANILTFIVYQGFVKSYWGKNCREEVSRGFNNLRLWIQFYITKKRKCVLCDKTFKPVNFKQNACQKCFDKYIGK